MSKYFLLAKSQMDKLLKLCGIANLSTEDYLKVRAEIDSYIAKVFEKKFKAKMNQRTHELQENYDEKFEDYKQDLADQFADYIHEVVEEEIQISEEIQTKARLGHLYGPLIDQMKTVIAVDEGLLDEEVKQTIFNAKSEIEELTEQINNLTAKNLELRQDARRMAHWIYLHQKCDGLPEAQKTKVIGLLEDINDKKVIDKKFDIIVETLNNNG
jgi:hypothetical protein